MPFYTYECPACGHRETVLRSMDDRNRPIKHEHGTEREAATMLRVQDPVPGVVKNPAAGPRRSKQ